jgi:hypothetical protein
MPERSDVFIVHPFYDLHAIAVYLYTYIKVYTRLFVYVIRISACAGWTRQAHGISSLQYDPCDGSIARTMYV